MMIQGLFTPRHTPDYLINEIAKEWTSGLSLAVYTKRSDEWLGNDFFFGVDFFCEDEDLQPDLLATDNLDDVLKFGDYLVIVDGLSLATDECLEKLDKDGNFCHLLFIENEPTKWLPSLKRVTERLLFSYEFKPDRTAMDFLLTQLEARKGKRFASYKDGV